MMWRFDRFGDAAALLDEHGQSLTYAQLAREGEALCGAIGGRCLCFNPVSYTHLTLPTICSV